jgi:23S rRNA (uracil1939-C5)-methyltransferase
MRYILRVRKGERVQVQCAELDAEGAGVGRLESIRVHVAGALPDETVETEIAHVSPHRPDAWGKLERVIAPSPARAEPVCPGFGECGGCVMQHMGYEAQREWKRTRVQAALAEKPSLVAVPVSACVPSPRPLGYRNRSKLVYAKLDGRPVLGAYAPRSHRVIDLAGCKVSEAPLDDTAQALLRHLASRNLQSYDERLAEGLLRYAVLRVNHLSEVLVTLVTAGRDLPGGADLAQALMADRHEVVGVVQNVNPTRGNALFGREDVPLGGRQWLDDKVGPVFVRLSPTAFFQVNRDLAAQLYGDVLQAAALTGTERVVDCYCGVGGLALTLAPRAAEMIGIEENPAAVKDALSSAQLNHATRTRFVQGDVAEKLAELDMADVIVLNPPRRGCAPSVITEVARLKPRLVAYVSCAPDTLARDLAALADKGYRTRSVRPYDMLPQTPHVEALAIITA